MEGDQLVWAKMKGFSPWPGMITNTPTPDIMRKAPKQKSAKCVFFFGTKNYAFIDDTNIKSYLAHKDELIKSGKTVAFKDAVRQMEEYISDPIKYKEHAEPPLGIKYRDTDAEFNALRESDNISDNVTQINDVVPRKKSYKKKLSTPSKSILKTKTDLDDIGPTSSAKRKRLSDPYNNHSLNTSSYNSRRNAAANLLNRPALATRPEPADIDVKNVSEFVKEKQITPSSLTFGFLGLGIMGSGIVKNLVNTGHKVVVWNRTSSKCRKFEDAGASVAPTPCDVIDCVDITFSCVSDPRAVKELIYGNCGILSSERLSDGRGYVEMTGMDDASSQDFADAIIGRGGRYLEAQLQGSKTCAEDGTLVILAAGDRSLFDECQSCFEAMGRNSFYLGDVGNASKMYLVLQMIAGISLAGLAEGMALAERAGLQQKDVLEVLDITSMSSQMYMEKGTAIINQDYATQHPLMHMQKDLRMALSLSDSVEQPLPIASAANEVYKHAKRNGYSDHDSSAVYVRSKL